MFPKIANSQKLSSMFLTLLLGASPLLISSPSIAQESQPGGSGGGGAMVCRDQAGNVLNSELTDLWEGRTQAKTWEKTEPYVLNIPFSDAPVEEQIKRAISKLAEVDPFFARQVAIETKYIMTHTQALDEQSDEMPSPPDALLARTKKNCPPEGMMYFDGEINKLIVKHSVFDKPISNTSLAAAWTHEGIYKVIREKFDKANDSRAVRKINACMYATDDCFGAKIPQIVPRIETAKQIYNCKSDNKNTELNLFMFNLEHTNHKPDQMEMEKGFFSRSFSPYSSEFVISRLGGFDLKKSLLGSTLKKSSDRKVELPFVMNGSKEATNLLAFSTVFIRNFLQKNDEFSVAMSESGLTLDIDTKSFDVKTVSFSWITPGIISWPTNEFINTGYSLNCTRTK